VSGSRPPELDRLAELERQMERASLFMHACLEAISNRLSQTEEVLVECLEAAGAQVEMVAADTAVADTAAAGDRPPGEEQPPVALLPWPTIALRVADEDEPVPASIEVNCAERMPVCQAACCKLSFALSGPEVESGAVKWDLGHPYMVRQDPDGCCGHKDRATGRCGIYADRPSVCRRYSCAGDERIWKDFDRMELNHEWIEAHLAPPGPLGTIGPRPRMEPAVG
jgi:Fe-S-cluster containining protein